MNGARLVPVHEVVASHRRFAGSLDPARARASDLGAVLALFDGAADAPRIDAMACALDRIATAIARHFPENIFADLDALAGSLWRIRDHEEMYLTSHRVAELLRGFGCHSVIRFRYVHDFLYGFDWARWVAKEPALRAEVGPFDPRFLGYLERRQGELTHEVERGGSAFDVLEPGAYRNPFCFEREPEAEIALHLHLAERDLVPVKAWTRGGESRWDRPFTQIRARIATQLGLAR